MEGLVLSYQDNYKQIYKDYNLSVSKAAEEACVFINENVTFSLPQSDLLFGRDTELAVSFARSRFTPADLTIDSFADHLTRLSDHEVRLILLANLNSAEQKKSYEDLLLIAQDENKTLDFISQTSLHPSLKWEALEIYRDVRNSMKAFAGFVKKYIPVYKKILSRHKKLIEPFAIWELIVM